MVKDMFSMEGKVVLVSGASSGIGLHVAKTFAAAGASVALAARRLDRTEAAAAEIRSNGGRAAAVFLDVTDSTTIAPAFDAAEEGLGAPVDVLVNNAGVLHAARFVEQEPQVVDRIVDTNLKGAFRVAQEAARRMLTLKRGAIVNVASTAALRAGAFMASYAASKAGVIQFSQVMALELAGKGVRVNVLCPGNIETEMQDVLADQGFSEAMLKRTPMRRFGRPEDLDGAFLLLASDAGRYMTGAIVTVDGGQTLSWM